MKQNGFSNLLLISIVVVVSILGFGYYFLFYQNSDPILINETDNVNEQIKLVILEEFKKSGSIFDLRSGFQNIDTSNKFARAEIIVDGKNKTVFLALLNNEWKVVEITEKSISCERAEKIGFPSRMVFDCTYKYPEAKTVSDVFEMSNDELLSLDNLQIIGQVQWDPLLNPNSFEIVSDNGQSITINFDSTDSNNFDLITGLSDGDYVVVDVSVSQDDSFDIIFELDSITNIESFNNLIEDNQLPEPSLTENNINDTEDDLNQTIPPDNDQQNDFDQGTDIIENNDQNSSDPIFIDPSNNLIDDNFDITNLETNRSQQSESYYQGLIDRDYSGFDVQIISDF